MPDDESSNAFRIEQTGLAIREAPIESIISNDIASF
jgi:hypothetical protein